MEVARSVNNGTTDERINLFFAAEDWYYVRVVAKDGHTSSALPYRLSLVFSHGTPAVTRTPTKTASPTKTRTPTQTATRTATRTATATRTRTPSRTASATGTITSTPTHTRTRTATATPTPTRTRTRTATPTKTHIPGTLDVSLTTDVEATCYGEEFRYTVDLELRDGNPIYNLSIVLTLPPQVTHLQQDGGDYHPEDNKVVWTWDVFQGTESRWVSVRVADSITSEPASLEARVRATADNTSEAILYNSLRMCGGECPRVTLLVEDALSTTIVNKLIPHQDTTEGRKQFVDFG